MMVPALPLVASDLEITAVAAQQVVTFYLFGLAAGQLVVGPAIDRLGRRPVLLAGLGIYTLAALIGAFATGLTPLLTARVLQAVGASAGLVTSRVIIGDLFDRAEGGRRQAMLMSVMLLSPAIAPVLGGFIAGWVGWRPIMGLLAIIGVLVAICSGRYIPESLPREGGISVERQLLREYALLFGNTRFVRTCATLAMGTSAFYMFLALGPFLLVSRWGLDIHQAGLCFLATAVAGFAGTLAVGSLERQGNALTVGLTFGVIGAILAFILALTGVERSAALIGPVMVMMVGAGITAPAGVAAIIHAEKGLSGTAVSLSGAVQMATAGSAAGLLGLSGSPTFLRLAGGMLIASLLALAIAPKHRTV
jgi:DHA1 family bicyclomycin/chloramphenicol resistance-like MFS transporter